MYMGGSGGRRERDVNFKELVHISVEFQVQSLQGRPAG